MRKQNVTLVKMKMTLDFIFEINVYLTYFDKVKA